MLALYLVAPGPIEPEATSEFRGHKDRRLTSIGVAKMGELADEMARLRIAPEEIYIAPSLAAWQTARILSHRVLGQPTAEPTSVEELAEGREGELPDAFLARAKRFLTDFGIEHREGVFVLVVGGEMQLMLEEAWYDGAMPALDPTSLEQRYEISILAEGGYQIPE